MEISTVSPLRGTKSLHVWNSNSAAVVDFAAQDEVWAFMQFNIDATFDYQPVMQLRDSSDAMVISLALWSGTTIRYQASGKDDFITAFTMPRAQSAFLWVRYAKGTGSNSIGEFYISTTATLPSSPTYSWTNSTSTAQVSRLFVTGGGGIPDNRYDYVRVSTSSIGSNPT
jgi:hypothetical protein